MDTQLYDGTINIRITRKNHGELDELKIIPQESFNNVITRLLESYNEAKLRTSEKE